MRVCVDTPSVVTVRREYIGMGSSFIINIRRDRCVMQPTCSLLGYALRLLAGVQTRIYMAWFDVLDARPLAQLCQQLNKDCLNRALNATGRMSPGAMSVDDGV